MGASRVSDLRLAGRVWIEALYSYILPHCTIVALDLESCIHVILILPFKCKSHRCHRVGSKIVLKRKVCVIVRIDGTRELNSHCEAL
jgi:hypothetical protein